MKGQVVVCILSTQVEEAVESYTRLLNAAAGVRTRVRMSAVLSS
jgi:hypothetical protein